MVGVRIISMRKHTKKNQTRVLFSSHQYVTVSQDNAHLLERCSLLKVCLYACGCVCLFMCLECVLDNSAVAEPLAVRPLAEFFFFILVNETLSVCKIKGSLQRHTAVAFQQNVLKGFQRCSKGK